MLEGVGAKPHVETGSDGTITLKVTATPQVLDVLGNERIYPVPTAGKLVLVIQRPGAQKP